MKHLHLYFVLLSMLLCFASCRSERPLQPMWASTFGEDQHGYWADLNVQGATQRFRWIRSGSFNMGSPEDEYHRGKDEILHKVIISKSFWMADTECTQTLWKAVMGSNPSCFQNSSENPVNCVSWTNVQEFLSKLNSKQSQYQFRLPTEAEWEYASRAGSQTPFCFGENITVDQVNFMADYPYKNGVKGYERKCTTPVKSFPPNAWGLYDVHGNVVEWCSDIYAPYPTHAVTDPQGDVAGQYRVYRGGGFCYDGGNTRIGRRDQEYPNQPLFFVGFRFCSTAQTTP